MHAVNYPALKGGIADELVKVTGTNYHGGFGDDGGDDGNGFFANIARWIESRKIVEAAAAQAMANDAARSRSKTLWVVGGIAAVGIAVLATVLLLRMR